MAARSSGSAATMTLRSAVGDSMRTRKARWEGLCRASRCARRAGSVCAISSKKASSFAAASVRRGSTLPLLSVTLSVSAASTCADADVAQLVTRLVTLLVNLLHVGQQLGGGGRVHVGQRAQQHARRLLRRHLPEHAGGVVRVHGAEHARAVRAGHTAEVVHVLLRGEARARVLRVAEATGAPPEDVVAVAALKVVRGGVRDGARGHLRGDRIDRAIYESLIRLALIR
eukprot:1195000-Prorocentrum_minimum.AAC.4